ncbi:uncharacterized protein [Drosophila virilis]|uniref:Uncharacterized protein n=1 Tax=Drosophila virilis TaxID=7244 RepID=B4M9X1_DROVI|nr:uncharacterized protein LOC6634809 [Drosophila virilis]EDW66030.1 uncharacterized protein Dvir_GJ15807 [Drosophila virilis]
MTTITVEDSEDKIIERLGDCDKVPVDYMDLLSHRVRCRKIEIFHYDDEVSFTANDEEEEQELSFDQLLSEDRTDDEDRTMLLVGDLDCLIRRIEQMQLVIKQRKEAQMELDISDYSTEQEPETSATPIPELGVFEFKQCRVKSAKIKKDSSPDQEKLADKELPLPDAQKDPLNCEEQLEVRNLQHAHHQLQCEIDELICNYRLMRGLLNKMRNQLCQENRRVRKLGSITHQYQDWSRLVAEELPVCKQRYNQLIEIKLSKAEANRVISAHKAKAMRYSNTFLTSRQLRYELREFHSEIEELKEYASDLRKEMIRRFSSIEHETGLRASNRLQSSISNQVDL